jgi:thiosulfate dehydrogenase
MIRGIAIGAIGLVVLVAICGYAAIKAGLMPANADGKPMMMERWAARTSLRATLAREAPATANPVPLTDADLTAGIKLYAHNCAVCHGTAAAERSNIAKGLYQKPPQLAKDGVEDDPEGETYWKIAHGIRFTGMPAFGHSLTERQLWQLTLFLKHMDGLPAAPERVWKAVRDSS